MALLSLSKNYSSLVHDFHEAILARPHQLPSKTHLHDAKIDTYGRAITRFEREHKFGVAKELVAQRSKLREQLSRVERLRSRFDQDEVHTEKSLVLEIATGGLSSEDVSSRVDRFETLARCLRVTGKAIEYLKSEIAEADRALFSLSKEAQLAATEPDPLTGFRQNFEL